ncbi:hypothetical protein JW935_02425 [candidate division KSB1 bacterium]|nr:hypothetical protein [candidate division KSB1 bacterium]
MSHNKPIILQALHLLFGLIFTITGFLYLGQGRLTFAVWIIFLGFLFLFDIFKELYGHKIKPKILNKIHLSIAAVVLLSGVYVLLIEFKVI